jgi:hypothetical protein
MHRPLATRDSRQPTGQIHTWPLEKKKKNIYIIPSGYFLFFISSDANSSLPVSVHYYLLKMYMYHLEKQASTLWYSVLVVFMELHSPGKKNCLKSSILFYYYFGGGFFFLFLKICIYHFSIM